MRSKEVLMEAILAYTLTTIYAATSITVVGFWAWASLTSSNRAKKELIMQDLPH